jgi:hypothetical protein
MDFDGRRAWYVVARYIAACIFSFTYALMLVVAGSLAALRRHVPERGAAIKGVTVP